MKRTAAGAAAVGFLSLLSSCATTAPPKISPEVNQSALLASAKEFKPVEVVKGGKLWYSAVSAGTSHPPEFYEETFKFKGGPFYQLKRALEDKGFAVSGRTLRGDGCSVPPCSSVGQCLDRAAVSCSFYWDAYGRTVRLSPFRTVYYTLPLPLEEKEREKFLNSFAEGLAGLLEKASFSVELTLSEAGRKTEKKNGLTDRQESSSKEEKRKTRKGSLLKDEKENALAPPVRELPLKTDRRRKSEREFSAKEKSESAATLLVKRKEEEGKEKEERRNTKALYQVSRKVALTVFPKTSTVAVSCSREAEKEVESAVRALAETLLARQVRIELVALETNKDFSTLLSASLDFFKKAYKNEFSLSLGENPQITFTNMAQNYTSGIATGLNLSALINYTVSTGNGRLINKTTLLSIPYATAFLKSTVNQPYLEPETITTGNEATQSYKVKYVEDGVELQIIPAVSPSDDIYLTVNAKFSQYLGDKLVKAGNWGEFSLPVEAPREIRETFRLKPGDFTFIGAFYRYENSQGKNRNFGIPRGDYTKLSTKKILFFIRPTLIKYEFDR